jgi:hypothetical protein
VDHTHIVRRLPRACHSSQLRKPGDFLTLEIFDQDVILTHTHEGELRAFYNVCQHRGLNSRGYKPGPLVLNPEGGINNELPIYKLHEWLKAAID